MMSPRSSGILTRVPSMPSTSSDADLLHAWSSRADEGAFEDLLCRHHARARRFALRVLGEGAADDAVSDAFSALMKSAGRFERTSEFGPWWSTILVNSIRKHARTRTRRARHETAAAARRPRTTDATPHAETDAALDAADLPAHLEKLPLDLRLPLVLHYYDGRSHAEVAETLGCPQGTASSRIRRGLEELHASLVGSRGAGSAFSLASLVALIETDARSLEGTASAVPSLASLRRSAAGSGGASRALVAKAAVALVAALALVGTVAVLRAEAPASSRGTAASTAAARTTSQGRVASPPSSSVVVGGAPRAAVREDAEAVSAPFTKAPTPADVAALASRVTRVKGRLLDPAGEAVAHGRITVSYTEYTGMGEKRPVLERAPIAALVPYERQVERYKAADYASSRVVDLATGRSGPDGTFDMAIPAPANPWHELLVSAALELSFERSFAAYLFVKADSGPTASVGDIALRECPVYSIAVTTNGEPVANAPVYFSCSAGCGNDLLAFLLTTDALGVARVRDPWGATEALATVIKEGFAVETVRFEKGSTVRIDLKPAGTVSGVVRLPEGIPAHGVLVEAQGEGIMSDMPLFARTDAQGCFELRSLRAGVSYMIETPGDDGTLLGDHVRVTPSASEVILRLERPLQVFVTLRAGETYDDRFDLRIQTRLPGGDWDGRNSQSGQSLGAGWDPESPVFQRVRPGLHRVIGVREGHAIFISAPFELQAGGAPGRVEAHFEKGRTAKGRLVDSEGKPVFGATFELVVAGEVLWPSGRADEDGRFELRELPADECELVVSRNGPKKMRVKIGPTQTELADIVFQVEKAPEDE